LILGSCVSRDIFNFSTTPQFSISDYYARSSLASLTTRPCDADEIILDGIESPFQRKMVSRDLDKDLFRNGIRQLHFDALLIDLVDERFNLYEMTDETVVTLSGEMLTSGMINDGYQESNKLIPSGSVRHRAQWKSGISQLFSEMDELGLAGRVIINKVFWSENLEDGSPLPTSASNGIAAANELLRWMYRELERYVSPERWMHFPESALRINPLHRWGIAPYHYCDSYYRIALRKLEKITAALLGHKEIPIPRV
jgi:hypothetical protein